MRQLQHMRKAEQDIAKQEQVISDSIHQKNIIQHIIDRQRKRGNAKWFKRVALLLGVGISMASCTSEQVQEGLEKIHSETANIVAVAEKQMETAIDSVSAVSGIEDSTAHKQAMDNLRKAVDAMNHEIEMLKLLGLDAASVAGHRIEKDLYEIQHNETISIPRRTRNHMRQFLVDDVLAEAKKGQQELLFARSVLRAGIADFEHNEFKKDWLAILRCYYVAQQLGDYPSMNKLKDIAKKNREKIANKYKGDLKRLFKHLLDNNPQFLANGGRVAHHRGLPVAIFPTEVQKDPDKVFASPNNPTVGINVSFQKKPLPIVELRLKARDMINNQLSQNVRSQEIYDVDTFTYRGKVYAIFYMPVLDTSVFGKFVSTEIGVHLL